MTKNAYLAALEKALKSNHVDDPADVLSEYEQHFAFKTADGYSEEEIIGKLESPETLAREFALIDNGDGRSGSILVRIGVWVLSAFMVPFFGLLYAWVAVMAASSLAASVMGICLIAAINVLGLIPAMPYWGSLVMGISFIALSVLGSAGTTYSGLYVRQLSRAYSRWAKNKTHAGSPTYPPLPLYPQLKAVFRRRLRSVSLIALAIVGISFTAGYIIMACSAGSLGFWHVWHWFQ